MFTYASIMGVIVMSYVFESIVHFCNDYLSFLAFDDFREAGFVNAIEDGVPTNISPTNLEGSMTYDNIWIKQSGKPDKQEYTGRSGLCVLLLHDIFSYETSELNLKLVIDDLFLLVTLMRFGSRLYACAVIIKLAFYGQYIFIHLFITYHMHTLFRLQFCFLIRYYILSFH